MSTPTPRASPAPTQPTSGNDEYDWRAMGIKIGMAIVAFVIIAIAMALAMVLSGGYGRLRRALRKRREGRRVAEEDEESAVTIEVAVRRRPGDGVGEEEEERRLSVETVIAARGS